MELPVQITFRDMDHSDALEAYVRQRVSKLETLSARITGCHVAVESPHRHKQSGRQYRVRVDLTVPGGELVVSNAQGDDVANQDAYAAIDEAFDEAKRRLREAVDVRRGDVKSHEHALHGRVAKLFSYEGYGFIETQWGDEVYFHRNSVLNGAFGRLERGDHVRFIEEQGDDGVHATSVARVG